MRAGHASSAKQQSPVPAACTQKLQGDFNDLSQAPGSESRDQDVVFKQGDAVQKDVPVHRRSGLQIELYKLPINDLLNAQLRLVEQAAAVAGQGLAALEQRQSLFKRVFLVLQRSNDFFQFLISLFEG